MIQLENVTRRYGKKIAVDGLTLEVPTGELFAFLGPNGAGKTTTIKMIVGLLRPTCGVVKICGLDIVKDNRLANRLLGYVPDVPYLYDKLTGHEFLQFIAEMHGLESEQLARQISRQIDDFDLHDFIHDLTESYSHGMKQRLTFAAAMLHAPPVLVIDEPMVGLDPRSVRLVKDLLQSMAARGTTIFMSTHLLSVAEEIAHRVGIVDQGRMLFLGTLGELQRMLSSQQTSLEQLYLDLTRTSHAPQPADSLPANADRSDLPPHGYKG